MVKVIIQGSWAHYVGTDYCDALGIYNKLEDAWEDAKTYAWDRFEEDPEDYNEDTGEYEGEGPDYTIKEYNPEEHDMLRAGVGSFEDDFADM